MLTVVFQSFVEGKRDRFEYLAAGGHLGVKDRADLDLLRLTFTVFPLIGLEVAFHVDTADH